jgi:hypothetical protein
MAAKPSGTETPLTEVLNVQDEKIGKVVEEVDRFFRSVHASIEDWKFAMEDDGDGTRIFVRFQIHINPSASSSRLGKPREKGTAKGEGSTRDGDSASRKGRPAMREPNESSNLDDPDQLDPSARSDPDLAPMVEEWKRKRKNGPRVEFHEVGAPLLDEQPEG